MRLYTQGVAQMAATATAGSVAAAAPKVEEHMDPRRLIAFFAMVVGMFMAILDIQIVSASLAEIQAGLSAGSDEIGWVQTSYLIAEVIMIRFRARWRVSSRRGYCFRYRLRVSPRQARSPPQPPISTR